MISVSSLEQKRLKWQAHYRDLINKRVDHQSLRLFYHSLVGGSQSLDYKTRTLFLYFGILHIAVISGLHITLLYTVIVKLLAIPWLIFYSVGWVSFPLVDKADVAHHKLALLLTLLYAWFCGFSPPCQRAFLFIFLSRYLATTVPIEISLLDRIKYGLLLQLIIFPRSFFSFSNFLSWSISIIIISQSYRSRWPGIFYVQLYISIFTALVFSTSSLAGFMANIFGALLFAPLIISMFMGTFGIFLGGSLDFVVPFQKKLFAYLEFVKDQSTPLFVSFHEGPISVFCSVLLLGIVLNDFYKVLQIGGQDFVKGINR